MARPPEDLMREALLVARAGLGRGEPPIGAVVVLDDRVIAAAHTAERAQGRSLVHAELLALEAADRLRPFPGRRPDARLFTTLEPCLMCLGAAMSFGLGEIHYALESPGDGAVALAQQWRRDEQAMPAYRVPRVHGGLLREESVELFKIHTARHSSGGAWEWARTIAALEQVARPTER
jgi:tRNA(adenine34) deaminase